MSHEFSDIHLKFAARKAGAFAAPTFSCRAWRILRAGTARAVRNAKRSTIRIDSHYVDECQSNPLNGTIEFLRINSSLSYTHTFSVWIKRLLIKNGQRMFCVATQELPGIQM
jgi:hypothetical protein